MKIQLKRSNVLDAGQAKTPTAAQMEFGELAVNYNDSDPALFLKDSSNNIIRIAGAGSAGSFVGYWSHTGNTLSPTDTNDNIKIDSLSGTEYSQLAVNADGTLVRSNIANLPSLP